MLALVLLLGQAAPVVDSAREARVLALLAQAHSYGAWDYASSRFAPCPPRYGGTPRVESQYRHARCGNSDAGTLDAPLARELALALGRIYGLEMKLDQHLAEGTYSVVLDAYDPRAKVGIDLEGPGLPRDLL